ncbi:MAG: glycoside hydrolase family 3 C-terminal domain-containing protein [Clostridia bacterium]|nr:glycoside hydrolase family 3 C-terminal domain-containing protein [Clostridia bacterium]
MLKYHSIIQQLSDPDKIRILCDIDLLSEKEYKILGIPALKTASISQYTGEEFPSAYTLANSWDMQLIGEVAGGICKSMVSDEVNLAVVPGPKLRINPFEKSISEDTLLTSEISRAYLKAAEKENLPACVDQFALTAEDIKWLDTHPLRNWLYQKIVRPYQSVATESSCVAVMTSEDITKPNYQSINSELAAHIAENTGDSDIRMVYPSVSPQNTVSYLQRNALFFKGAYEALESALSRYHQIIKAIEHGKATSTDLKEACARGRAISPEDLDLALDRLLDFVHKLKRKVQIPENQPMDGLKYRAVSESIVLLKNEYAILPAKKSKKIALIGDLTDENVADFGFTHDAVTSELVARGYTCIGHSRGYDLSRDRSEELLNDAVTLCHRADIALVFLGFGKRREAKISGIRKLTIPANQQHLLDQLQQHNVNVVAVIPSEYTPDVGLPHACAAMLMVPYRNRYSLSALLDIFSGKENPSGKLANTVYFDADHLYTTRRTRQLRDEMKTGPFVGYRYYDAAGLHAGFCFGHGLSYTKFVYSQLSVTADRVRFTVQNMGLHAAAEIAQVYIGLKDSDIIRPKKELCAFQKIFLSPGERKTVDLPLKAPEIYLDDVQGFDTEEGTYTVYVGSSLEDIRLTQNIHLGGQALPPDNHVLSDYLPTVSNIITDHYTLEAERKRMKKSFSNLIVGIITLALAIALQVYCAYAAVDAVFFDIFSLILAICGVGYMIRESIRQGQLNRQNEQSIEENNQEQFKDAQTLPVYAADQMFVQEFDMVEEAREEHDRHATDNGDAEFMMYIDKEQTFATAANDFMLFAAESGLKMSLATVKQIFASLASSRLLLVHGMSRSEFQALMQLLGNYFDTLVHMDTVDKTYTDAGRVLFGLDEQGKRYKTNVFSAIEAARNTKQSIHFAAMSGVHSADLMTYFTPYMNYIRNPLSNQSVRVLNDQHIETSYVIPQNLWFVLHLVDGEQISELPDFVTEVATLNTFSYESVKPSAQPTHFHKFSYYQMQYLTEKLASTYAVDEDAWKKIDKLTEFVNEKAPYHLGNKMWLCLESFVFAYIACENESEDAMDAALATKLLPDVISVLTGKIASGDKGLLEILECLFGDEHVAMSQKLIRTYAADIA